MLTRFTYNNVHRIFFLLTRTRKQNNTFWIWLSYNYAYVHRFSSLVLYLAINTLASEYSRRLRKMIGI